MPSCSRNQKLNPVFVFAKVVGELIVVGSGKFVNNDLCAEFNIGEKEKVIRKQIPFLILVLIFARIAKLNPIAKCWKPLKNDYDIQM
ncbi:MAG: hypothetical protein ACI8YQ_002256 [Polaribacter sp.]|jgi:hypothetical protein